MCTRSLIFVWIVLFVSGFVFAQLTDYGNVCKKDAYGDLEQTEIKYAARAEKVAGAYGSDFRLLIKISSPAPKTIYYRVKLEFAKDDQFITGLIYEGNTSSQKSLSAICEEARDLEVCEIYYEE